MKYYFGAACLVFAAVLVVRAIFHRRRVLRALARPESAVREPQRVAGHVRGLQSLRTGCGPLFVLLILLIGVVLSGLWFVLDKQRILSGFDIAGFLVAVVAYVFSMGMRLRYSVLGLGRNGGEAVPASDGEP